MMKKIPLFMTNLDEAGGTDGTSDPFPTIYVLNNTRLTGLASQAKKRTSKSRPYVRFNMRAREQRSP